MQVSFHTKMKSSKEAIFQEEPQTNPFVVKSILESKCKRFRKSAIRENFNLEPGTQLKITHSYNESNYTHQNNEVKENL